jgi:hypothetical protein
MGLRPVQVDEEWRDTTLLACHSFTVQQVQLTVDFTIEPRPSGAVIPGAFTHSFFNGAVLNHRRLREHRRPEPPQILCKLTTTAESPHNPQDPPPDYTAPLRP